MLQHTDRQAEEEYLRQTMQVVEDNIENYSRETKRMQADIDEMLEHYHDNDTEVWIILNNTITLNEHMKAALARNQRAMEKPYFGRIIFWDETLEREESLYIGKGGISKDSTHQMVTDWRAPVANIYYENGLGKCSYVAPGGKELPIDLQLKRTYEIAQGQLESYFDTEVVANDDLLMKYLSKNKQAVLSEIVATIQKEQNEIIRKSPYHNLIVQGVAGSGKTTVAMHRISFILYNYQERFKPEDFYIVGSNRILLNYITGVLPDLDVYGVRQMTMEQLFIRLLYEDWDEKKYSVRAVRGEKEASHQIVKGTSDWFCDLVQFIRKLEKDTISQESVFLNRRQFVEGLRDGKNGVYDRRDEDKAAGRREELIELVSGEAVKRYIEQNPKVSIQSKINMLNERLIVRIRDEFLGKNVTYTEVEKKAILKEYRGRCGDREWKQSIFKLYETFLREQREKGYEIELPTDSFDVYDLAALALLYKLVKETEIISEAHHIVIDEAQDFGMMAYLTLHACIKDCTYTVMGDVSQNIHFGYGLNDWEELRRLLLSDPMDNFGILRKSYRNTVEISDFATNILRHGSFSIYPVEPIVRHGRNVVVEELEIASSDAIVMRAAKICRDWQEKQYDTIAVVCRNAEDAKEVSARLSRHIEIIESDLEKADFGSGIMVLPVEYTKGLEFDAVLIWNPTREDYPVDDGHARLLYVAATRALHELCILHAGNLTGLIADPVPQRESQESDRDPAPARESAPIRKTGLERAAENGRKRAGVKKPSVILNTPVPGRPASQPDKNSEVSVNQSSRGIRQMDTGASSELLDRGNKGFSFGDMPATERLRPAGHSKINLSVKWISKEADGLYLQSQYGTLRICPVGSGIVRLTFAKGGKRITDGAHPFIAVDRVEKNWKYKDNGKWIEVSTEELTLRIDKLSGSIQYYSGDGKLLLSERKQESRQIEDNRTWLYLDWQKGEQLFALGPENQAGLALKNSARILTYERPDGTMPLPLILSDRGYGILPAVTGVCFSCDIPAYGSYLYAETEDGQMDYYVIRGKQNLTVINAYAYLCGLL